MSLSQQWMTRETGAEIESHTLAAASLLDILSIGTAPFCHEYF
jgi:hypothetical protein